MSSAPPSAPTPKAPASDILGAPRRPVTRYRRQVVVAIGVGVLVVFTVALMIGFKPRRPAPEPQATAPQTAAATPDSGGPSLGGLARSYGDADGPIGRSPPTAFLPAGEAVAGSAGSAAPAVQAPAAPLTPDQQAAIDQARNARSAGPFFAQGPEPARLAPAPAPTPIVTAPAVGAVAAPAMPPPPTAALDRRQAFASAPSPSGDYVEAAYVAPRSIWEIKAGSIIPAALVTGLNSDLPGQIIAQVTQGVFDHVTGKVLLIPQGARLIGRYDSQVEAGQNRALIVWDRIIMPDGRSIDLGAMTGADLSGASGLKDGVDSHVGPISRAIALSTAITAGGAIAQNASARSSGSLVLNDAAGGVSSQASQLGQRFVDRVLGRAPTITVRPGWPLTVLVSRDLILSPY